LKWIRDGGAEGRSLIPLGATAPPARAKLRERVLAAVAAMAVVVALALGSLYFSNRPAEEPAASGFLVDTPQNSADLSVTISPDGRRLVLSFVN